MFMNHDVHILENWRPCCKKWENLRMQILHIWRPALHCSKNLIYVFPEMKLLDLIPSSYIYVS